MPANAGVRPRRTPEASPTSRILNAAAPSTNLVLVSLIPDPLTLTRLTFYELVWSKPMSELP
jgi:hypothetical protein